MAWNNHTPCSPPAPPFSNEHYPRLNMENQRNGKAINQDHNNFFYKRFMVIQHSDSTKKIGDMNPFYVERQLKAFLGKKTWYKANKIRSGHLLIEVDRKNIVDKLKKTKTIGEIPVEVKEHKELNSCKGRVFCDNIEVKEMSNDTIKKEMADQNVSEVYRQQRRKDDGTGYENTDSFIVTFDTLKLPNIVKIGYIYVEVQPYIPNPRICFNCQRYGHGKKTCTHDSICAKCAQKGHEHDDCENDYVLCYHCEQQHKTTDKKCPMFQLEKMIIKEKTRSNIPFREARRRIYNANPELTRKIPKLRSSAPIPKTSYSSVSAVHSVPNEIQQQLQNQQQQIVTLTNRITDLLTIIQQSPALSNLLNVEDSDMETNMPRIPSYQRKSKNKRSRMIQSNPSSDEDSSLSSPSRRKVAPARTGASNMSSHSNEETTPHRQGVSNMPDPLSHPDQQVRSGEGGRPPSGGKATNEEATEESWTTVTGKNPRKTGAPPPSDAAPLADASLGKKHPSKLPQAKKKVNTITPPNK